MRGFTSSILIGAAFVGTVLGVTPAVWQGSTAPNANPIRLAGAPSGHVATIYGCRAVDGDTLRCGRERIRLLAIDAPELPGHCQPGRTCAPGDPFASTVGLQSLLEKTLSIERVGEDKYGRTLAVVANSRGDLSCAQLQARRAIYRADWDDGGRVAHRCPDALSLL